MNAERDKPQISRVITIFVMAATVSYFFYFSYSDEEKIDFQPQDEYNIPTAILSDRITDSLIHSSNFI